MSWNLNHKLARISAAIIVAVLLSSCTTALVDERVSYWSNVTKEALPPGTSLQKAKDFFASKGLELRCCVSSPPQINKSYLASENKVGHSFFIAYDVVILVDLSQDEKVEKIQVQRWGVWF